MLILTGRGSITIGDAAVAIVSLQQLSSRLQSAGGAVTSVHEGVTFLGDFENFRASLPAIRETRPTGRAADAADGRVGRASRLPLPGGVRSMPLRDVSFELARGQVMAIVGANGSGKTTLAKLLCDLLRRPGGSSRGTVSTSPAAIRRWSGRRSRRCSRTTPGTC